MDRPWQWRELEIKLSHLLCNEAPIFSRAEVDEFRRVISWRDGRLAGQHLGRMLDHSHLQGEVKVELAKRFQQLVGAPVPVEVNRTIRPDDLDEWLTVPESSTMELPIDR